MTSLRKTNTLLKLSNNTLIDLPTPLNITTWWNFGSLLGLCLLTQILTGLFLAMHYSSDISTAYSSVVHICRDVNNGWIIRNLHANGASFTFICIYLHMGRSLYYASYLHKGTWNIGIILFLLMMITAFMGYVLPWGQMSLWGATVITNMLSAAPYVGEPLVQWLWGGFSVDSATLSRFFAFHFTLPFIVTAMVAIHLIFLHETGSNNPTGLNSNPDKIHFHPYFSYKDLHSFLIFIPLLTLMAFYTPNILWDPENFSAANAVITPQHIKPEWYFLFAYTILRSVPNKIGGVIALIASTLMPVILPYLHTSKQRTSTFRLLSSAFVWLLLLDMIILTWIGALPAQPLFVTIGQIASVSYFFIFLMFFPIMGWLENKMLH